MIEKIINLENISLIDFLGVENNNINIISDLFPKTKILARGNEIKICGTHPEISKVNKTLISLLDYFNKYGSIDKDIINSVVNEASYHSKKELNTVILYGNKGNEIKAKSLQQQSIVDAVKDKDLVFIIGPAGTGKTFLAVSLAVKAFKEKEINKIIITRPAVEAGEHLGFLPGDLKEKVDPYLRPIYDALEDMIPLAKLKNFMETGLIEIAPLAFLRGRTLNNSFILLDEAQNTSPTQLKMFLTRLGKNSKMIINGDLSQIDLPSSLVSGLNDAREKLANIPEIEFISLSATDVMRNPLVKKIIKAYK